MPYGLYISAEGAQAQTKRLEVIANNLANVDTPGFKRDLMLLQARHAEEIAQGLAPAGQGTINDIGGGVELRGTVTDYSTGTVKRTGIPTDLAIDGDGFFVVNKGEETYLTRAGNFVLSADGTLMTPEGHAVLSDGGAPVTIDPALGSWRVTPDGGVLQAGIVTPLAVVRPRSLGDLVKVGQNMFHPLAETVPVPAAERRVNAGFLEMSGVKPTLEMMDMIEATRAFEANVSLIRTQDEMLGTMVNRLMRSN